MNTPEDLRSSGQLQPVPRYPPGWMFINIQGVGKKYLTPQKTVLDNLPSLEEAQAQMELADMTGYKPT